MGLYPHVSRYWDLASVSCLATMVLECHVTKKKGRLEELKKT